MISQPLCTQIKHTFNDHRIKTRAAPYQTESSAGSILTYFTRYIFAAFNRLQTGYNFVKRVGSDLVFNVPSDIVSYFLRLGAPIKVKTWRLSSPLCHSSSGELYTMCWSPRSYIFSVCTDDARKKAFFSSEQ